MVRATILDFAAYELKKSFDGYGKKYRFNKFMYLVDNELKKEAIDIKLPYSWYRHGVVVEYDIDDMNYISSLDFSELSQSLRNKVVIAVNVIMDKYRFITTDEVNQKLYQEAPYEFQDDFREILEIVKQLEYNPSELYKWVENSLIDFPSDDFSDIYPLFLEWENYMGKLIEINYPKKKTTIFIKKFWFTFAEKLRLLTYKNIDQDLIDEWEDIYKKHFLELKDYLFNFAFEFYNEYYTPPEKHESSLKSEVELHKMASKTIWE